MWGDVGVCSCFNRKTNHSNGGLQDGLELFICNIVHLQEVQVHNVSSIQSCLKYQKVFQKNKFPLPDGSSQVQIADDSITITTIGQGFSHYQSKQPLDPKKPMKQEQHRGFRP